MRSSKCNPKGSGRSREAPAGLKTGAGIAILAVLGAALAVVSAAIASPQSSIPELAAQADQLEGEGRLDDAFAVYLKILRLDPKSIAALNRLGAIEVRREKFSQGVKYYRQALALDPNSFATNLNLGIACVKNGRYREAVEPLGRAVHAEPSSFQAQELLGAAQIGGEDFTGAIPHLERARDLNPRDSGALYLLARAYLETRQFNQAFESFRRLEALDPDSPWLHVLEGQADDGVGAYEKAISEFERARAQLPGDSTVRFSLGFLYWKVHHYADAEAELEEALRLDPDFRQAKYYLADTYLAEQQPARAQPLLSSLSETQPRDARVWLDLGKALDKLDRGREAVEAYQTAIRLDPKQPEAHYHLAQSYRRMNQPDQFQHELALAQQLQKESREQAESLLKAAGRREDPARQLGPLGGGDQHVRSSY